MPHALAAEMMFGAISLARASAFSNPVVWLSIYLKSMASVSARCASSAENKMVSVPGATGRNRSASSQVAVRRGSMTTILAPRSLRFFTMR